MKILTFFSIFLLIGFTNDIFACFPECHPEYSEWLAAGQPACWCRSYQCKGDADGQIQGNLIVGFWNVGTEDLDDLVLGWTVKEPPEGPGIGSIPFGICADFDHRAAGSVYTGYYRINPQDVCILAKYWQIPIPPKGPGIDPNCLDCVGNPRVVEGPELSIWTDPDGASGFGDYDEISVLTGQHSMVGILNGTSDPFKWYDGYLIITEGLEHGSWTGVNWVYSASVPGWTYYGTSPDPNQDAWFAQVSSYDIISGDPEMVSAWLEYVQEGMGDTTISLYNEYYELVDTLVIHGSGEMLLLSPNGGEVWEAGQVYEIIWETVPEITDVMIEYSINDGSDWLAVSPPNSGNTGSYSWLVPMPPSSQCLVRVSDSFNPTVFDQSDAMFTIKEPDTLTIVGPNGGERLVTGSAYPIEWTSTGTIADVILEYTNSDGSSWEMITASTENDGAYLWDPVPDANSPDCRVRITDVLSDANDVSDDVFTIFNCLIGPIPGDINEDCYVNLDDLAVLSLSWMVCGNPFDMLCVVE